MANLKVLAKELGHDLGLAAVPPNQEEVDAVPPCQDLEETNKESANINSNMSLTRSKIFFLKVNCLQNFYQQNFYKGNLLTPNNQKRFP